MKKIKFIKPLIVCIFFIALSIGALPFYLSYAIVETAVELDEDYSIDAFLYNTNSYTEGDGVTLTEEGATVEGWQFDTSKFLQITPRVTVDSNVYVVSVRLSKEFYAVNAPITPGGFSDVKFTKNPPLSVNGTESYSLNTYSGSFDYYMEAGAASGTIQLELRYDAYLWDKFSNSSLTKDGDIPIEVTLSKLNDDNSLDEIKNVSISKATSGSSMYISKSHGFYLPNNQRGGNVSSITDSIRSRLSLYTQAYTGYYMYYPKMELVIQLPYFTDSNDVKHYLKTTPAQHSYFTYAYNKKVKYEVDTSKQDSDGIIVYTFSDIYFKLGDSYDIVFQMYFTFPDELIEYDVETYNFTGGSYKMNVTSNNGKEDLNLASVSIGNFIYTKKVSENVTLSVSGYNVTSVNRPSEAVSLLGGFYLANSGTADSCAKTIYEEFDIDNTNKVRVTTINTVADPVQKTIDIEYTLVDEDGERVFLNSSGERVEENDEDARGTFIYNMTNSYYGSTSTQNLNNKFMRSQLPEEQKKYYFKTIKYTINRIAKSVKLHNDSSKGLGCGGNFFGYIDSDVTATVPHRITVTSSDSSIANKTSTVNTYYTTTDNPAYGIDSVSLSKTNITAGESIVLTATAQTYEYPYGNSQWLQGIRFGLLLPKGVSINESSVKASTSLDSNVLPISVTSKDAGAGKLFWTIIFPEDIYLGYASESLGALKTGTSIKLSVQLDTDYSMNNITLFAKDMVFVAGLKQTNSSGGAKDYSRSTDKYDLNENGSVDDYIGGVNSTSTVRCEVVGRAAVLGVSDSVNQGSESVVLNSKDDVFTYNLNIESSNGGFASDFQYFVPITKTKSGIDSFLIQNELAKNFDLSLNSAVSITGSDIYNVVYAFEEGLTYDKVSTSEDIVWYSADDINRTDSLSWENVTMVKITAKGDLIENGSSTRISFPLKYGGSTYNEDAGMSNIWHGAGYYHFTSGSRETSGNFSSPGVMVTLNYTHSGDNITLTAAQGGNPQVEGNVNEIEIGQDKFPNFKLAHSYEIVSVTTYNVNLKTKEYMQSNAGMAGNDANRTFGITVKMSNGEEKSILDTINSTNPLAIGSTEVGVAPSFKYKIYNADSLSDNATQRYITVTIKTDNGVTITQRIDINRELTKASDPQSAIVAGKSYLNYDDTSKSVTISSDSALTVQFVTKFIPNLYGEHILNFSNNLSKGTTITLVNVTNESSPSYWYYNVTSATNSISLNDFYKMGTKATKGYSYESGNENVEEKLLFIIDFSNVENNTVGSSTIDMTIKGKGTDDVVSEKLTFVTTNSRTFQFESDLSVQVDSPFEISYTSLNPVGAESKYEGRKFSLVVTSESSLPTDSYLVMNGDKYYLNSHGEFILPLSDLQLQNGRESITFSSNSLPKDGTSYKFNLNLWVSQTANALLPKMGENILNKVLNVNVPEIPNASLKVTSITNRLIEVKDLSIPLSLYYDYIGKSSYKTTIELQQKIGNGYQTVTDKLNQVNGNTNHEMGVYTITSVEGPNSVNLRLSSSTSVGTYRFLIKVISGNNEILTVPYNFIVIPSETN